MTTITIKGTLTPEGIIQVDLPDGWQPGEISVEIAIEPTFTDAELDDLMTPNPKPANQIKTGGWEDLGIADSVEWVKQQRKKRNEQNKW